MSPLREILGMIESPEPGLPTPDPTSMLIMRLVGLGNIVLETSDKTTPQLTIPAIAGAPVLLEKLRAEVEKRRDRKRVREVDFE